MTKVKSSRQATIWTVVGYGASQSLRLAGNLVLARLLIPDDFGMMALIAILMQGLTMFSDVGIGPSIIRSKRGDDPRFLNTAWTIQVIRGLALWICACILAFPFAQFYQVPLLTYLIPVACAAALFAGFNSTSIFTENRALNLGRISAMEIGSQVGGLAVMIAWALTAPTVWALVAGGLAAALLKAGLSHIVLPGHKNRFHWDASALAELLNFGKWIFLSTALAFCSAQIDRMILGKLVPLDVLGVYTIGLMWARAPLQLSMSWSSKVFYPVAARAVESGDVDGRSNLTRFRKNLLMIVAPLIAGLIVAMPRLIELLYLPSYQLAGIIGSIFAVGAWLAILSSTYGAINMATGKPQYISFAAATQIILFVILVFPFFENWGVPGVAFAVVSSRLGPYLVAAIGAYKARLASIPVDIVYSLLTAAMAYLLYTMTLEIESRFNSRITELFAICLVSGVISLAVLYVTTIRYKDQTKTPQS